MLYIILNMQQKTAIKSFTFGAPYRTALSYFRVFQGKTSCGHKLH